MTLGEQLDADLLAALKSGDALTKETLRFLKSSLQNARIAAGGELNDDQIVSDIQKEVKKRIEAETIYKDAGKTELAAAEAAEIAVLQKYLPSQMDEAAIKAVISDYLQANPTDMSQFGPAMGALGAKLKGQADMGLVSKLLRDQLQK